MAGTVGDVTDDAPTLVVRPSGRWLLSAIIIVWIVGLIAWNMPDSATRRLLIPRAEPVMSALGLRQSWGVFSPNPRTEDWDMTIELQYVDGTTDYWTFPDNNTFGMWVVFRWQKTMENIINPDNTANAEQFALWLVRTEAKPDVRVERVVFRHEYRPLGPMGQPGAEVWQERVAHDIVIQYD